MKGVFKEINLRKEIDLKSEKNYIPTPIDVSDVILPKEIEKLTELLAEQVHEMWSLSRIKDGWIYGEERNDEKKTTPCLIPYSDLSESEKEYDRITAIQTLKFILKKGFTISK